MYWLVRRHTKTEPVRDRPRKPLRAVDLRDTKGIVGSGTSEPGGARTGAVSAPAVRPTEAAIEWGSRLAKRETVVERQEAQVPSESGGRMQMPTTDPSRYFTSDLSFKVFMDRYTLKDIDRRFAVGDFALALIVDDPQWPRKEVARVLAVEGDTLELEVLTGTEKGERIVREKSACDRPIETSPEHVWARVAKAMASVEPEAIRADWEHRFFNILDGWKFVPGGRILAGSGLGNLTLYNCYVVPSPKDSRAGIIDTLGQMIEIMSRGGGVGINVSSLRPRRSVVRGVNGRSSGAVSWMDLYSRATGLVEQGGCFGPDERIMTDHGLVPAAELYRRMGQGESFRALTHEGQRPITARFRNGTKRLYRVTTQRGYLVEVTAEHKMGVLRNGQIATVPLADLAVGAEILTLLGDGMDGPMVSLKPVDVRPSTPSTGLDRDVRLPEVLDPRLAYVLGYLSGGKYLRSEGRHADKVRMATSDSAPEIRARLSQWCVDLFGLTPTVEPGTGAFHDLILDSRLLTEWFETSGLFELHAGAMRVPEAVLRSPSEVAAAFVAGVFDGGCTGPDAEGGYGIEGLGLGMLRDLQQLLAANGVASRLSITGPSTQGSENLYRLDVTGIEDTERFETWALHSLKRVTTPSASSQDGVWSQGAVRNGAHDRMSKGAPLQSRGRETVGGNGVAVATLAKAVRVLPDAIVRIEPSKSCEVYDFEVAGTHMLAGNGVYTSNSRRGALMLMMHDWHPDVLRFIDSKRTAGMVENANISVCVSDAFMAAVKADAPWDLRFPDTDDPEYDRLWDGDLDRWASSGHAVVVYDTVPARQIWQRLIESAWASAEPGVAFLDRSNKMSNSHYFHPLIATNPCVTGDTWISTADGLRRADELYLSQESPKVVVDTRMQAGPVQQASPVFLTGVKAVVEIRTEEGLSLRATADHRILTEQRGWIEAGDLRPGEAIRIVDHRGGFGTEGTPDLGRLLGYLSSAARRREETLQLAFLPGRDELLRPLLEGSLERAFPDSARHGEGGPRSRGQARAATAHHLAQVAFAHGIASADAAVPDVVYRGTEGMQKAYVEAFFEAVGTVTTVRNRPVLLAAGDYALLQGMQRVLLNLGIYARIRSPKAVRAKAGDRAQIRIERDGLIVYAQEIGAQGTERRRELAEAADALRHARFVPECFLAHVAAIDPSGTEPVYDLTEPVTHSFVAGGVVVHNCAEQPLPEWGVCCLGHVNLAAFVRDGQLDWEGLGRTVRASVRFLDDVVDATPYYFDENRDNQMSERRLGMGTMGLGEVLIRLGLRYGSPESVEFIDRVYAFVAREAYLSSADTAAEKGPFPRFEAGPFLESGFMRGMPQDVREAIAEKGMRNVTLLTQAPTGTIGTMVGTSTGIEPFYALKYVRQSRLGRDDQYVLVAQEWLEAHPGQALPDYFVGAMDLTPEEHVQVQAAVQRWTDSSISKTANTPSGYTVEETARLYELAYDLGCKGVTIYRDQSRQTQVLHLSDDTDEKAGSETVAAQAVDAGPSLASRPRRMRGECFIVPTHFGNLTLDVHEDPENGEPVEVIASAGTAGSDLMADAVALGMAVSVLLRLKGPVPKEERLRLIMDKFRNIGGSKPGLFGPFAAASLAQGLARGLDQYLAEKAGSAADPIGTQAAPAGRGDVGGTAPAPGVTRLAQAPGAGGADHGARLLHETDFDLCPACGGYSMEMVEGCRTCHSCGFSNCS